MNRFKGNALLYYFITICCGVLTYTWGRRSFLTSGDENSIAGYFILYGVIVCVAVLCMRRYTYRRILELEPKTYKKLQNSKGKQRPLEIAKARGEQYSPQVEELLATYNTFRLICVVMILISLAADCLMLM